MPSREQRETTQPSTVAYVISTTDRRDEAAEGALLRGVGANCVTESVQGLIHGCSGAVCEVRDMRRKRHVLQTHKTNN